MGELRDRYRVAGDLRRVHEHYITNRVVGKSRPLMKALISTYKGDFCILLMGSLTASLLKMLSPFIVLELVNFIEAVEDLGPEEDPMSWENSKKGVWLAIGLVVS